MTREPYAYNIIYKFNIDEFVNLLKINNKQGNYIESVELDKDWNNIIVKLWSSEK